MPSNKVKCVVNTVQSVAHWSGDRWNWVLITSDIEIDLYLDSLIRDAKESTPMSSKNIISHSQVLLVKRSGLRIGTDMSMQFIVLSSKLMWKCSYVKSHVQE